MIAVKDILKMDTLSGCKLVSGEMGLNREVKFVTVMEVPEVTKWLKGGEIILTSLYAIKDDEEAMAKLVEDLVEVNAAALFIKTVYTKSEIPSVIKKSGDLYGLPIFYIPDDVKYLDIMPKILTLILSESEVDYKKIDLLSTLLSEISIHQDGLEAYIQIINLFINNLITIETTLVPYSNQGIKALTENQIKELLTVRHVLPQKRVFENQEVDTTVSPLIVDGIFYGAITSWKKYSDHNETELKILEKAVEKLSFEILKIKVKLDIQTQYESDFLREIFFSEQLNTKNIEKWGNNYRVSDYQCYRVYIVSSRKFSTNMQIELEKNKHNFIRNLKKIHTGVLVGFINEELVIVTPGEQIGRILDKDIVDVINQVSPKMLSFCVIGKGREVQGIRGIKESYKQAEKAVVFAKKETAIGKIVAFDQIGINRVIYVLEGTDEYQAIYCDTIEKIITDERGQELLQTLVKYFEFNESLKNTADHLFIHVNTLKYRLKNIEDKTELSFNNTKDKLMLYLGTLLH